MVRERIGPAGSVLLLLLLSLLLLLLSLLLLLLSLPCWERILALSSPYAHNRKYHRLVTVKASTNEHVRVGGFPAAGPQKMGVRCRLPTGWGAQPSRETIPPPHFQPGPPQP